MSVGAHARGTRPRVALDAMVIRHPMSGVERSIRSLVQALGPVAPDMDFLVYYPRSAEPPGRHDAPNVSFHRPLWPNLPRVMRILWQQTVLPVRIGFDRVDLLHAPAYTAPVFAGTPFVLTVYDVIALKFPRLCKRLNVWHYRVALPLSVRRAARIIVPSERTAADVRDMLGAPANKIRVIPLGVSDAFRPVQERERLAELKRRYGLTERYVLFVGNLEPKKNLLALLEAFAEGRRSGRITHRLVLAGAKSWNTKPLVRAIREHRLAEAVTVLRAVDDADMPLLYAGASVFVFPSIYEGFGLPPIEAMACGVPVIASSGGAVPEVVGDAALTVRECDPRHLRIAIEKVIANTFLRERLRQRGLARAKLFTWERTARATAEVYREVLTELRRQD